MADVSSSKKKIKVVKGYRPSIVNERFLITTLKTLASDKPITKRTVNNIWYFLSILDRSYYSRDYTIGALLQSLDSVVESRLDGTFDSGTQAYIKESVINKINTQLSQMYTEAKNDIVLPIIMNWECKEKDVVLVDDTISTYNKYAIIIDKKDELNDIVSDISSGSIMNLKKSINELETFVQNLSQDFRGVTSIGNTKEFVHLMDIEFPDNFLREVYNKIRSPKANLKTGLKMFNQMLSKSGGFVSSKFYIIYADVNSFKSALMQHISRWIRMYNHSSFYQRMIETKKRPTVLHVNLENILSEDAERFFKISTTKTLGECSSFEEMKHMWFESTMSDAATGSCIDITLVHRDADELSVSDIDGMIDTLNDDGYEVIAVVVDYIELIKPENGDRVLDRREQLSKIAQKMHGLAVNRDIPVITAQQINREGQRIIGEAKSKGQTDVIKLLNRSYIGESMAIDKKTDFSMFIGMEKGRDGKVYLGVKRDKMRYNRTDIDYFAHEVKSGIVIEDDALFGPEIVLSKSSLSNLGTDGMTFSGKENTQVGSRGYTSLSKTNDKKPEINMQTTVNNNANWVKTIDDKSIDQLFMFGYVAMNMFGPKPIEDCTLETIDGSEFYFDNIIMTPFNDAVVEL